MVTESIIWCCLVPGVQHGLKSGSSTQRHLVYPAGFFVAGVFVGDFEVGEVLELGAEVRLLPEWALEECNLQASVEFKCFGESHFLYQGNQITHSFNKIQNYQIVLTLLN